MLGLVHGTLPSTILHVDATTMAYPGRRSKSGTTAKKTRYPLVSKRGIVLAQKHSLDGAAIPA
jgi:hypothetical protein